MHREQLIVISMNSVRSSELEGKFKITGLVIIIFRCLSSMWCSGKFGSTCWCRRHKRPCVQSLVWGRSPEVGNVSYSTPVFLLGKFYWQRSLGVPSTWGHRVRHHWQLNTRARQSALFLFPITERPKLRIHCGTITWTHSQILIYQYSVCEVWLCLALVSLRHVSHRPLKLALQTGLVSSIVYLALVLSLSIYWNKWAFV